ncbi:MAG: hypothetical protein KGK03_00225 [Candidatus Omnitrophica bacterium]|nr:hypothetical protein [Candidatus Omnitrophota bacterium]MDE2221481.1 hypothetical protein [Candidatus Omnitrophota bacterium]
MKILRILLSIMVASYMTQVGYLALAQDVGTSPFSVTFEPLQYAYVKGNVGKFQALNWMKAGENPGASDISFVKQINKDISVEAEGSVFPKTDDGTGHLVLQDGDLAFLQVDYKAFRKWYDGTGGFYPNNVYTLSTYVAPPGVSTFTNYGTITVNQGAQPNSPALQMDISYFKLEAGLGPISDPYLDIAYEHNTKNGDKSLLEWTPVYVPGQTASGAERKIGPAWGSFNDYVDTITLKEKKEIAGVTLKGEQKAEIDYNNDIKYMQYLNDTVSGQPNQLNTFNESPDAKLFGAGVRAEKWMLNDNTYAALGYHYNHIHDTDLMQQAEFTSTDGVVYTAYAGGTSGWNYSKASEDDHVWVGNLNSNLTKNLSLLTDVRYEHQGTEGDSTYYATGSSGVYDSNMANHEDQTGEHIGLRYFGIPHTSLYMDGEWQQDRNWVDESYIALSGSTRNTFSNLERLNRTQKESWTVGGRIYPNRFFIFSTQVRAHNQYSGYDTISNPDASGVVLMSSLREKGVDETSTLTWKPFRWIQNSLKYQFSDTVYNPRLDPSAGGSSDPLPASGNYNISENHMLTSAFTYDITVQPIDPLLLMLSYSHVENYVRTIGAADTGTIAEGGPTYIPVFNSGDNSWLFSTTYCPSDNWDWTNTVSYTISNNYVDSGDGVPYGSDFKMFNFTSGLEYKYHHWLKISPQYEYAAYKDNPVAGAGNYSANIFILKAGFDW